MNSILVRTLCFKLFFLFISIQAGAQVICTDLFGDFKLVYGENSSPGERPLVYITGASSGIGEALAHVYAKKGYDLVITARRTDKLSNVAEQVTSEYPESSVLAVKADVTSRAQIDSSVRLANSYISSISVVIANAGMSVSGNVQDLSIDDFKRQFDTNVWGLVDTYQATIGDIRANRGSVVLIGSVIGDMAFPGGSAYAMSKFAVRALADSLRAEEHSNGVRVVHIQPGFINTEFRRKEGASAEDSVASEDSDWVPQWMQMPALTAARQIFQAVKRGRREKVLTNHGRFGVAMSRYFPGISAWIKKFFVQRPSLEDSRGN